MCTCQWTSTPQTNDLRTHRTEPGTHCEPRTHLIEDADGRHGPWRLGAGRCREELCHAAIFAIRGLCGEPGFDQIDPHPAHPSGAASFEDFEDNDAGPPESCECTDCVWTGRGKRVERAPRISRTRGPVPQRTGPLCFFPINLSPDRAKTRFKRPRPGSRRSWFNACLAANQTPPGKARGGGSLTIQRETSSGNGLAADRNHAGVPQRAEGCVANAKVAGSSPAACSIV